LENNTSLQSKKSGWRDICERNLGRKINLTNFRKKKNSTKIGGGEVTKGKTKKRCGGGKCPTGKARGKIAGKMTKVDNREER